mmetsp:Transcript_1850/g.4813  ORF Transcript_1850/g.4813 Transcript_1850/m.4813 type:complete len:257 (-) Transcript_1850:1765-2535(-)
MIELFSFATTHPIDPDRGTERSLFREDRRERALPVSRHASRLDSLRFASLSIAVRSMGAANLRKGPASGDPRRLLVPEAGGAVAGGRSTAGSAVDHELADRPLRAVTAQEVLGFRPACDLLVEQAGFVELRDDVPLRDDVEQHRVDRIQFERRIEHLPNQDAVRTRKSDRRGVRLGPRDERHASTQAVPGHADLRFVHAANVPHVMDELGQLGGHGQLRQPLVLKKPHVLEDFIEDVVEENAGGQNIEKVLHQADG